MKWSCVILLIGALAVASARTGEFYEHYECKWCNITVPEEGDDAYNIHYDTIHGANYEFPRGGSHLPAKWNFIDGPDVEDVYYYAVLFASLNRP